MPEAPQVSALDYTSVTITWSAIPHALSYAVFENSTLVLEMPASLTRATIGILEPRTSSILLEVRTVLLSQDVESTLRTITASTQSLPSSDPITNFQHGQNGDIVIFAADVPSPFAFVHLFIRAPYPSTGASSGWPVNAFIKLVGCPEAPQQLYKPDDCLVEGNDLHSAFYRYSSAYVEGQSNRAD